ncbi:hypothetical protein HMPREF9439_00233 [Parasutterella excrementihominis YIT 11859]|uniref:Uncharacterized protein n=1 Tax=Parasutterella excrementihominis YIT 11859 TaxID=762966 RepID=F3QH42_9BURK|nr:hypothetical protein HMPREF9439_00233 [Parasutterella excrementihominis YIT 11859]
MFTFGRKEEFQLCRGIYTDTVAPSTSTNRRSQLQCWMEEV